MSGATVAGGGALDLMIAVPTKAVAAVEVSLSPAVGAGGGVSPRRVGAASGARRGAGRGAVQKWGVAMGVSFSPGGGVGAVGLPVRAGDASGALSASAAST